MKLLIFNSAVLMIVGMVLLSMGSWWGLLAMFSAIPTISMIGVIVAERRKPGNFLNLRK